MNLISEGVFSPSTHFGKIKYQYSVNGKVYTGSRLYFGDFGLRMRSRAEKIVSQFPEEEKVLVYHDPNDPESAVLIPGITKDSFGVLGLGLICILGSLHMLFSAYRKNKVKKD